MNHTPAYPSASSPALEAAAQTAQSLGAPQSACALALAQNDSFPLLEWYVAQRTQEQPGPAPHSTAQDSTAQDSTGQDSEAHNKGLSQEAGAAFLHSALEHLRTRMFAFPTPEAPTAERPTPPLPPVVFGTSGHRGVLGQSFTFAHVHAIVAALVETLQALPPAERKEYCGAADWDTVRARGITIGHDNRLFNKDLSGYTAYLLHQAGFRVRYAGRVTSPQLSLLTPQQGWCGALNFTPSHNPFPYGGIKYNPTDGGLAGKELSQPLAERANAQLLALSAERWPSQAQLQQRIAEGHAHAEMIDPHGAYLDALARNPVLRLDALPEDVRKAGGAHYVVDAVWGAAVPLYQRLIQRLGVQWITLLHTEDDPFFGGQSTEPNVASFREAQEALLAHPAPLRVAVRNDPDGDRGLVGDEQGPLRMNHFAALALRYLHDLGLRGDVVTSYPTSHFAAAYAEALGCRVETTPTGFKNFRSALQNGALLAYEESEGLTIQQHTLDKDGIFSGLLALRIVLHYRRSLHALLAEIETQHRRYWEQESCTLRMPVAQARQRLERLGEIRPGEHWEEQGRVWRVREVFVDDGYKFFFPHDAWAMIRPSGTEPKLRLYAETRADEASTRALCAAARKRALSVIGE